jgi:hypothetical protein
MVDVRGKRGTRQFDGDLLLRMREAQGSGNTVSEKEVRDILKKTVSEYKDEFRYTRSKRGLEGMATAIANTLEDAVNFGWVKGAGAKAAINAFLGGDLGDHGSLDHTKHFINDMVNDYKENNPARSTSRYSGS